jgi:hypothetical protein
MAINEIDTVVMSGGAPTSPLMAGFLYAMIDRERGKKPKVFRNFHTSGAGALMALLTIAPRGDPTKPVESAKKALQEWVESGVADEIYKLFPVNFKLFRKPGPFTPMFRRLAERYKVPPKQPGSQPITEPIQLLGDTGEPVGKRDPIRELLAEWVARPAHDSPSRDDIKRRRANSLEQLYATLLNLWDNNVNRADYRRLMLRKDPVKLFRDKWMESLFTSDYQRRVYNDLVELWFALLTPSTLAPRSEGLAASLPFLEDIVDFDRLKGFGGHYCVNAYNMSRDALAIKFQDELNKERQLKLEEWFGDLLKKRNLRRDGPEPSALATEAMTFFQRPKPGEKPLVSLGRREKHKRVKVMELFEHPRTSAHQLEDLGPEHIRAAFSMPFIYPPTELNESYYSEGADHEPINFHEEHLYAHTTNERVVLLDVLATLEDYLVRRPRDLWDAYVISIMTPVVALAKAAILEFDEDQKEREGKGYMKYRLDGIDWNIPSETQPYVMDWSYSNLDQLFRLGEKAGRRFVADHDNELPDYDRLVRRQPAPRRSPGRGRGAGRATTAGRSAARSSSRAARGRRR